MISVVNIGEAICFAIFAWTFSMILIDGDMIFSRWWEVLNRLPMWLSKPLGACEYCFAGQSALWGYIIIHHSQYNVLEHIMYVSITIFSIAIINRIIYGTKNT